MLLPQIHRHWEFLAANNLRSIHNHLLFNGLDFFRFWIDGNAKNKKSVDDADWFCFLALFQRLRDCFVDVLSRIETDRRVERLIDKSLIAWNWDHHLVDWNRFSQPSFCLKTRLLVVLVLVQGARVLHYYNQLSSVALLYKLKRNESFRWFLSNYRCKTISMMLVKLFMCSWACWWVKYSVDKDPIRTI